MSSDMSNFHAVITRASLSKETLSVLQRTNDDILLFLASGNEQTQVSSYNSYERLIYHQVAAYYGLSSAPTFRGSTVITLRRTGNLSESERAQRVDDMKRLLFNAHRSIAVFENLEKEKESMTAAGGPSEGGEPTSAAPSSPWLVPYAPPTGAVLTGPIGPAAASPDSLAQQLASMSMGVGGVMPFVASPLMQPMPGALYPGMPYGPMSTPAFPSVFDPTFAAMYGGALPMPFVGPPLAMPNPYDPYIVMSAPGYGHTAAPLTTSLPVNPSSAPPLATKVDNTADRYRAIGGPLASMTRNECAPKSKKGSRAPDKG